MNEIKSEEKTYFVSSRMCFSCPTVTRINSHQIWNLSLRMKNYWIRKYKSIPQKPGVDENMCKPTKETQAKREKNLNSWNVM